MKQTTSIEIDVASLYQDIGVDLTESSLAPGCLAAIKSRLLRMVTKQMLIEAMLDASKPPKRIRKNANSTPKDAIQP